MAISLSNLKQIGADKPPRILLYGPPGIGKTTLAAEFPDPVILQIEDGMPAGLSVPGWGREDLADFPAVMDALGVLYNEDHGFRTLIVDSVTELQRLIFTEACARGDEKGNSKANIEDFGYGKGYVYATRVAGEFIDWINALRRDKGMAVVLIAHSSVQRFDDPESAGYDRYEIALRSSDKPNADLRGMFERDMDAIILLKQPVTLGAEKIGMEQTRTFAKATSVVQMHTRGTPAYTAKNRYDMPATIRYDKGRGFDALAPYFPGFAGVAPAQKKDAA